MFTINIKGKANPKDPKMVKFDTWGRGKSAI